MEKIDSSTGFTLATTIKSNICYTTKKLVLMKKIFFFFVLRAISIGIEFVIEIIGSSVIISFSIKFLT